MAAHTVGDYEQAPIGIGVGVKAVFVACADAPDVGAGGDGKLHVDGVALTRRMIRGNRSYPCAAPIRKRNDGSVVGESATAPAPEAQFSPT